MRRCCGEAQCTCAVTAGPGITVVGNGSPSTPYQVSAIPIVFGCGLAGDGSVGTPLAVAPAAGEEAWPWECDVATESTLKCDPDSGELWTPPEHFSAAEAIYVEHFPGGGPTLDPNGGGWVIFDTNVNTIFGVPANFVGNMCRSWSYFATVTGTFDVSFTEDAEFELGYAMTVDGGPGVVTPAWGILAARGAPGRERHNGTAFDAAFGVPADAPRTVVFYLVAAITAGQIVINSWNTYGAIHTTTGTP
ncbi:hypothetical protein OG216_19315 [Streptomycetaceae bacterium NBC_01309]